MKYLILNSGLKTQKKLSIEIESIIQKLNLNISIRHLFQHVSLEKQKKNNN